MRIRKRGLYNMLSQTAASDPQLQPTTSHESHPITPNTQSHPSDPYSDRPPKILATKFTNTWQPNSNNTSHSFDIKNKMDHQTQKAKSEEASGDDDEEENGGARKQNIILAAAPVTETVVSTPLSSRQVDERWFDHVDKNIPATKRKGLDAEKMSQETPISEKAKKLRSKTSKKCSATSVQQNDGEQDKLGNTDSNSTNNNMNIVKTNKRGGAIMEGSRCSRVNGRGWRCCQQTLVGYSLCEHHLGKGRLRSITNTKARAKKPTAAAVPPTAPHNDITSNTTSDSQPAKKVLVSSSVVVQPAQDHNKETMLLDGSCYDEDEEDGDDDDYNDDEMKKPLVARKKRMKLGVVKARSLSSLLNQTNNAVAVAADDIYN